MKFKVNGVRSTVMAGMAMVLLASCGGGTQIEAFVPRRVIAFGDEASVINTDGTKWAVNAVEFDTTVTPSVPKSPAVLVCTGNQVWVQQVAYSFGLAFTGRCPSTVVNPNGVMMAAPAARAADVAAQVSSFMAGDAFGKNDLVTVMAGTNDIVALYESQADPTTNAAALIAAAQQAGTDVGAQVVRITDQGAKVIVSTIPNVGFTPYAVKEEAAHPGGGRTALLSTLTEQFNTRLRLKLQDVRDGGRAVGLVLGDEMVLTMVRFPATFSLSNITEGACAQPLPNCNAATGLVTGAQATYAGDWLWSDDLRLGAAAHNRLGGLAVSRARSNPF